MEHSNASTWTRCPMSAAAAPSLGATRCRKARAWPGLPASGKAGSVVNPSHSFRPQLHKQVLELMLAVDADCNQLCEEAAPGAANAGLNPFRCHAPPEITYSTWSRYSAALSVRTTRPRLCCSAALVFACTLADGDFFATAQASVSRTILAAVFAAVAGLANWA